MAHPITAIIFDFGNVLVKWDARNLYKRFFPDLRAVDSFLEEIRFQEWNALQDAGRPFKEGIAELSKQFPQYTKLIEAYDTHWEESISDTIIETVQIVQSLKKAGWNLYLLSNFSVEKFGLIQLRYKFLQCFDGLIISGEHQLVKPDPAIFELTLGKIDRKAGECLFIDDSLPNVDAARKIGMQVIHYQGPKQLSNALKKLSINGK